MRIAIITDFTNGRWAGCEELWADLARSALAKGHKVAAFLIRNAVTQDKIQPLIATGLELHMPGAGARFADHVRNKISWRLGDKIASRVRPFADLDKFGPDIVFISAGDSIPTPMFLLHFEESNVQRWPYAMVCHNSHLFGMPLETPHREAAVRYFQGARCVLFTADRTRRETEHRLGASLPGVRLVVNPISTKDTSPIPMPTGSTVRMASVGRLFINSKGQDILLAALGSHAFKTRDWKLSIYGEGGHLDHLNVLARHYEIAEKVEFRGHSDIRSIWAEHHVLTLPSRNESSPLVLVEAMVCGRPSVVNDVGGICEWASEPETAFVSRCADLQGFSAALERAWSQRETWESMGARARKRALEKLDPDPGGTLLKILEEVADERRITGAAE